MDEKLAVPENYNRKPNCYICRWRQVEGYAIVGKLNNCGAQGFKSCDTVYDNENCKILYEPEVKND